MLSIDCPLEPDLLPFSHWSVKDVRSDACAVHENRDGSVNIELRTQSQRWHSTALRGDRAYRLLARPPGSPRRFGQLVMYSADRC